MFQDLSKEMISKGQKVDPLMVFREVVQNNARADVGGHIQFCEAKRTGVEFTPILVPDEDNPDHVKLTLLGLDISSIGNVDGFDIGHRGMGIFVEKVVGRQALRAKGIDPDEGPIPNDVQNEASLEAALRYCVEKNVKLGLSNTLDLRPIRPAMGQWYYVITCSHCSADTPVCMDPSSGKLGNVFEGAGTLRSTCWKCGHAVSGGARDLKAFFWDLPAD
jgi:hypothetical protein